MDICETVHLACVCQREGGGNDPAQSRKITFGLAKSPVGQDEVRTRNDHEDAHRQSARKNHGRRLACMVANRSTHNPMAWDFPFPAPQLSPVDTIASRRLSFVMPRASPHRDRMNGSGSKLACGILTHRARRAKGFYRESLCSWPWPKSPSPGRSRSGSTPSPSSRESCSTSSGDLPTARGTS